MCRPSINGRYYLVHNHLDKEMVCCKREVLEVPTLKAEKQISTLSSFVRCLLLGSKETISQAFRIEYRVIELHSIICKSCLNKVDLIKGKLYNA